MESSNIFSLVLGNRPLPHINNRTIMQTIYAHATDTKKQKKYFLVSMCEEVW